MNNTKTEVWNTRHLAIIVFGTVAITVLATLVILSAIRFLSFRTRQAAVAVRGTQVMPFDLEQTTHVFQQRADGGIQTVTANDPSDSEQIALIQAHLQEETAKFRQGDFSDPAKIHGPEMPGLAELRAGMGQIAVRYTALPNGAQITYTTTDSTLVMALHEWFTAQRADHGDHATDH